MIKTRLRNGKRLDMPSLFVNPQTSRDSQILKSVNSIYGKNEDGGIPHIEGIIVRLCDCKTVGIQGLIEQTALSGPSLSEKVIVIDPALDIIFQGTKDRKNRLFKMKKPNFEELAESFSKINSINYEDLEITRLQDIIDRIYPLLDINFIRQTLEFQLNLNTDICVIPSVPLTTMNYFDEQIAKIRDMHRIGFSLMQTIMDPDKKFDWMFLISLHPRLINNNTIPKIKETLTMHQVDHYGIKLLNDPDTDPMQLQFLVNFLDELDLERETLENTPSIHLWNTRELGYMAWCHGVNIVGNPIATYPYFRDTGEDHPEPPSERTGRYYHPRKKIDVDKEILLNEARKHNYAFPCSCEACSNGKTVIELIEDPRRWNKFRRTHFLLAKNEEVNILKNDELPLKRAVHAFFADPQSDNSTYLRFLS